MLNNSTAFHPSHQHNSPDDVLQLKMHIKTLDYVEMALLVILFIFGAPNNVQTFTKLHSGSARQIQKRFQLLKTHLTVSDLMVLFLYVTYRLCTLALDRVWNGGRVLCKGMNFLNVLSFQVSSNIIVCIAMDRMFQSLNKATHRRTRIFLWLAWAAAAVFASPQLLIWDVHFYRDQLRCTVTYGLMKHQHPEGSEFSWEDFYNLFHVVTVFWLPAAVICVCYTCVIIKVIRSRRWLIRTEEANNASAVKVSFSEASDYATMTVATIPTAITAASRRKKSLAITIALASSIESIQQHSSALVVGNRRLRNCLRKHSRTFYTATILVIAYVVCWLPYNMLSWYLNDAATAKTQQQQDYQRTLHNWLRFLQHLIVLNSVVNPYLYQIKLSSKSTTSCQCMCFGSNVRRRHNGQRILQDYL